jgi:hypothetical protein
MEGTTMTWANAMRSSIKKTLICMSLLCTPVIAQQSDCLQFSVVGICYWYYYYGSDTTILYGHFNPDVIVSVTNPQGVDRAEGGGYLEDTQNRNHQNLIHQDARAFGHPLTGQIYCPSNTDALSPYFLSEVDIPSWRWGGLDIFTLGATIPGWREIGRWPLNTWGAVYPRTGWTIQHSEPKSSGVVAQRVGDIITRDHEPHIYLSILGDYVFVEDDLITWSPDSLEENTNEEGWWESLEELDSGTSGTSELGSGSSGTSELESGSSGTSEISELGSGSSGTSLGQCSLFGENDTASVTGWGGGRVADDGEYLYTLWRPYTCCEVSVGVLIKIQIVPYPIVVMRN